MVNLLQITYTAMGWKTLSGYAGGSLDLIEARVVFCR